MIGYTEINIKGIKKDLQKAAELITTQAPVEELEEMAYTMAGWGWLVTPEEPTDDEDRAIQREIFTMEKRLQAKIKGVKT